jgi:hypothetical protein
MHYLPGLALNFYHFSLSLSSSYDYRNKPPVLNYNYFLPRINKASHFKLQPLGYFEIQIKATD